uniref:Uncharacterized protein n=1 Tax=Yersinia ruckeri TaxID=29486 RepID=A0A0A8VCS3_YERRU|nr:hypothetical protein CSF007_9070 [Yersinia ruckeri]
MTFAPLCGRLSEDAATIGEEINDCQILPPRCMFVQYVRLSTPMIVGFIPLSNA